MAVGSVPRRTRRTGRKSLAVLAAVTMAVSLLPAVASAQEPNLPTEDDPRVGLGAGWTNAEEVAEGVELLAHRDRPAGFFDPGNAGSFAFAQSDLGFTDTHAFVGSFNGFNIYDITNPEDPTLVNATVCPGGQGDVSVYGDLLFISVEEPRARVDCGADQGAGQRFQGVRIFDVSDVTEPQQVAAVQSCRGSHTHTLVDSPDEPDTVYVYVSGTAGVRPDGEDIGLNCETAPTTGPDAEPLEDDARWRIDVIEVPLDAPEDAALVGGPRLFADEDGNYNGLQNSPPADTHPSGGTWSPNPNTNACHDITAYPAIGLAAGACQGNGILIDISDPANPTRLAEIADENFAYWHSATFSDDGSTIVFTDEWGGGTGARCRATDQLEWGANAIVDVVEGDDGWELEFASYYKIPPVQTETENCVAHNGNLLPHPTRDLMVQAWYQGGMSIFDFTDSSDPQEIAYFDRGPISATGDTPVLGGYWSTYWHNGYIYGAEIARGFDVFRLTPTDDLSAEEIAIIETNYQSENNPQLQRPFGEEEPPPGGPGEPVETCAQVEPVSFSDVVDGPHFANIECAAGFGVALGSVDGTFRPGNEVRRDQMASFIARLLTVAGVELPADAPQAFGDVVDGPHQVAIDQLAALDVVQGRTGGTRYDPAASVTRAQMASFLVRSIELVVGEELDAPRSPFTDVAGSVHTGNIDVAYDLGIALGRDATTFAPQANVLRGQMASFLARTLGHLDEVGVALTPIGD